MIQLSEAKKEQKIYKQKCMNPNETPEGSRNSGSRYKLYLKSLLLNSGICEITLDRQP